MFRSILGLLFAAVIVYGLYLIMWKRPAVEERHLKEAASAGVELRQAKTPQQAMQNIQADYKRIEAQNRAMLDRVGQDVTATNPR